MSSRSKGRGFENRTKALLEADGWVVELVKGGTGWQKSTDFFGMFDIIALHPALPYVLLIQVKGGKRWYLPSLAERTLISRFIANQAHVRKEWWAYRDRVKEPRILVL